MMHSLLLAAVCAAPPGFDPSSLVALTETKASLPLPAWIPDGYKAQVFEGTFNVNGQRFVTVEYAAKDPAKSFAFQFAAVHLGTPLFADETARPRRVDFNSPALGKSHFLTATVRGLPECQTPWIKLKRETFPRYGAFVSLGIKPEQALRILRSVKD